MYRSQQRLSVQNTKWWGPGKKANWGHWSTANASQTLSRQSVLCLKKPPQTACWFIFFPPKKREKITHRKRERKKEQRCISGSEMPGSKFWGNLKVSVFYVIYSHYFLPLLNLPGNFTLHQFLIVTDVTYMLSESHCCWKLPVQPQPHSSQSSPLTC